jgi:hypothetical protein
MKKAILVFLSVVGVFTAQAQSTFSIADTVKGIAGPDGTIEIHNDIIPTSGPIKINWKVKSVGNLPASWYSGDNNFGICDNNNCFLYTNDGSPVDAIVHKTSFITTGSSTTEKASRNFKIVIDAGEDYPAGGPYYITATLTDTNDASSTKNVVFAFSKWPTSVSNVNQTTDDISIYPNPAKGDINVVFNGNAGIKNISVYNLIGKVVSVYKVNGNSAKLDLSNMPSGIYFMRLVDNTGRIVATRKFTHQ